MFARPGRDVFHDSIVVAPLKPGGDRWLGRRSSDVFHDSIVVAPLKLVNGASVVLYRCQRLPRLHRRGPIEAERRQLSRFLEIQAVFHDSIVVAPLKRVTRDFPGQRDLHVFHDSIVVAPLKLDETFALACIHSGSSTTPSSWPH